MCVYMFVFRFVIVTTILNIFMYIGELPVSFTNMSKLTSLDLSHNKLTGTLPKEWSGLEGLTKLRLSRNPQLTPEKIPREWKQLRRKSQLDIGALDMEDEEVEQGVKVNAIEVLDKGTLSL